MQSRTKYYLVVVLIMLLAMVGQTVGPLALTASAGAVRDDDNDKHDKNINNGNNDEWVPTGKGHGKLLEPGHKGPAARKGTAGNGISYHGGSVILGTTNVYYIWYGNWSSPVQSILTDLANNIGGSPYFNINTTYYNGNNTRVSNAVHYAQSTMDNYSQGTNLSDAGVQAVVSSAISSGRLPQDTNGVYFVLTSADVNETSGFCTRYCGWHTSAIFLNLPKLPDIKFSFVGNPARCPSACAAQTIGPNGNAGADGMASIIAHELEEAVTDPDLNAWYDSRGQENADKCAWTFGTLYRTSNGAYANMKLGTRDFLIQQNWVNAKGGYCAKAY